jgi:hypothetical protein
MKKAKFFSVLLAVICLFTQCESESVEPNKSNNHINFVNLAVGQKSQYVRWESRNAWQDNDTTYKQTKDTIQLSVISKDSTGFKVTEDHLNTLIPISTYYFKISKDSLYVFSKGDANKVQSTLFNFGKLTYPLKDNDLQKLTLNQWAVVQGKNSEEFYGKTGTFKVMGKTYNDAFVYYNGKSIVFDGPILTRIYTPKDGFISFQALGGLLPYGNIYSLVP